MKHLSALLAGAVIALYALPAVAGVVIEQDQTVTSGDHTRNQHQTVIVEGNKQKLVTPTHEVITDLDKGKMYVVDPAAKTYIQMDFPPTGNMARIMAANGQNALNLTSAGTSRTILNYKCNDYKGQGKVMSGDYTITECFSTKAPGAAEFTAFEKKMRGSFKGTPMAAMATDMPDGIPMASDSTMKMGKISLPGLPPDQRAKIEAAMANRPPIQNKTVVTKVTAQKLAASTFEVPSDFKERQMPGPMAHGGGGMMRMPVPPAAVGSPSAGAGGSVAVPSPAAH
jgi:hypothetical protein